MNISQLVLMNSEKGLLSRNDPKKRREESSAAYAFTELVNKKWDDLNFTGKSSSAASSGFNWMDILAPITAANTGIEGYIQKAQAGEGELTAVGKGELLWIPKALKERMNGDSELETKILLKAKEYFSGNKDSGLLYILNEAGEPHEEAMSKLAEQKESSAPNSQLAASAIMSKLRMAQNEWAWNNLSKNLLTSGDDDNDINTLFPGMGL